MERLEEERGRHLVEVEETKFRMDMFDEETKAKLDFGGEEEKEATASVVRQHLLSASLSPLLSWRLSIEYFDVVGGEDEVGGRGVGGHCGGEEVNKQTECHSIIIYHYRQHHACIPLYLYIIRHAIAPGSQLMPVLLTSLTGRLSWYKNIALVD